MSTKIQASCLCGQLSVTSLIPNSKLPLDLYVCSCNTCRFLSGTLAISSVNSHEPISIAGKFTRYATSTGPRGLDRCFCPVCGTYVFEDCPDVSRIGFFGGAMENVSSGTVKFRGTIYAASTIDGGLTTWLSGLPAWATDSQGEDVQEYIPPSSAELESSHEIEVGNTLECSCLCGNVQFRITRPNESSSSVSSHYSDSLVPFHAGAAAYANSQDEKWWIRGEGPLKKYAAAVCACDTCRKASGQDLVQWAFVPESNIEMAESVQLGEYSSSKDVTRSFCRTCGARVFWKSEARKGLVDVAVGLMRSAKGSRAEDWLDWLMGRISFVEDAQNEELVGAVEDGMQRAYKDKGQVSVEHGG